MSLTLAMTMLTFAEFWQIVRFGVVGVAASALHIATAAALLIFWPLIAELWANLAAYSVAFTASLLGHQYFTFRRHAQLSRFLAMSLCGFALNNGVLVIALWGGLAGMWAIIPAVLVAASSSYLLSRVWVFSK